MTTKHEIQQRLLELQEALSTREMRAAEKRADAAGDARTASLMHAERDRKIRGTRIGQLIGRAKRDYARTMAQGAELPRFRQSTIRGAATLRRARQIDAAQQQRPTSRKELATALRAAAAKLRSSPPPVTRKASSLLRRLLEPQAHGISAGMH